ncbi:MAG: flavodoxin domain-containing protein [Bifidobacteriaceae bacterium]|nr:flavodoxin domain-containing protein [Bifidobacteriaceae bacterium]
MKALVAVASKHGATLEMGRHLGDALAECGVEATVCPADQVTSLRNFDFVVLGTAVYANKMLPQMTALCYRFSDHLAHRPVYLFCSGPVDAAHPETVPMPMDARDLVRRVGVRGAKTFGGRLSFDLLRPTERALMRMVGARAGDYRDWDTVEDWARWVAEDAASATRTS